MGRPGRSWNENFDAKVEVPFWCDSDGHLGRPYQTPWSLGRDKDASLDIDVYTWNDNLMGWPLGGVRTPPNIRVLHVLVMATLNVMVEGNQLDRTGRRHRRGWVSVAPIDGKPPSAASGKTGGTHYGRDGRMIETIVFGPFLIEVVQPVSMVNGLLQPIYFTRDSSSIGRDEGGQLAAFVRKLLSSDQYYEVRAALESGLVRVRGECRASATFKGSDAERVRYNQKLSEDRKATVLDRLARLGVPRINDNQMKAIGDSKGKAHQEDPVERRCDFEIKGDELVRAVQELWKANRFLGR
jgi:hypothetical protein